MKQIITITFLCCLFMACSSDDDANQSSSCNEIIDQIAQGTFKGNNFMVQGGTYRLQLEEYFCQIYVSQLTGGDCSFPQFGGNNGAIIFSLPNLDPQTIRLSDVSGEGESLNFNSILENVTFAELATCGQIEILSSTSTSVNGRLVAIGQEGSSINGNFTLTICE